MTELLTEVSYGRVHGRFLVPDAANTDVDAAADDVKPASGSVTFTPTVERVQFPGSVPPVTITPKPVTCQLDSEGYVIDANGKRGVWLVATDDTDGVPAVWGYKVRQDIVGVKTPSIYTISVPAGGEVDLASAAPAAESVLLPASIVELIMDAIDAASSVTSLIAEDHGDVAGSLVIDEPGSHEMDLTGDLDVTVETLGDVTMYVHATGQELAVAGDTFEIDGDEVVVVVTSPRGVQYAWMVGAGGGTPAPPVTDPPTQPGAATFTPTDTGGNVAWLPSTVAAGYEVQTLGGVWVDVGLDLDLDLTGYTAGTELSGFIRAYNSLGARTPSDQYRAWSGTVNTPGLHEQILALEPEIYLRMSQGSLEVFDADTSTSWTAVGAPMTFDGEPLVPGATGSAVMDTHGIAKFTDAFAEADTMTVVAVVKWPGTSAAGSTDLVRFSTETEAEPFDVRTKATLWAGPTPGLDHITVGSTHTMAWRKTAEGTAFEVLREGAWAGGPDGETWSDLADPVTRVYFKRFGPVMLTSYLFITTDVLSSAQVLALAEAGGTEGNPR